MDKNNKGRFTELLSPAGDKEALVAAICTGCDAVYFGTDLFNARIRANNFSLDEAREAIKLCHAHGVKAFVTLNIAVYDKELPTLLEYVNSLYVSGVDALIVSDIGVMSLLKERFPDLELHASTQASVHNTDGVKKLAEMGCARVVVARELSRESIARICKNTDTDIEIFVHGAHCMSVSGQCLMSYAMGGRSGNRGECAQPCRLPYKINGRQGYPLSLKDMSLSAHIPEIIDTGAASLKIEGRMKSAEYVGGVTKIWRKLLDSKKSATAEQTRALKELFSRQGFTDGYFEGRIDSSMLGVRSEEDKNATRAQNTDTYVLEKPKADLYGRFIAGEKASLTVTLGTRSVTVYGATVEEAVNAPMSGEAIEKNLIKLGNTPLCVGKVQIEKSDNIMVRVSSLNALRREAVDKLLMGERMAKSTDYVALKPENKPQKRRSALFARTEQIPKNRDYFDIIYVYADRYKSGCGANGICLPPVILDTEWGEIEEKMIQARADGVKYALITNIGQTERARAYGFELIADFRFNIFNAQSAAYLKKEGFSDMILSPELTLPQARDIGEALIVYGKLPVMITHKCIIKDSVGCDKCRLYLKDRTGADMYCEGVFGHRSMIYNSVPIYMADRLDKLNAHPWHFIFSDESEKECFDIIEAYKHALAREDAKIRRIKA